MAVACVGEAGSDSVSDPRRVTEARSLSSPSLEHIVLHDDTSVMRSTAAMLGRAGGRVRPAGGRKRCYQFFGQVLARGCRNQRSQAAAMSRPPDPSRSTHTHPPPPQCALNYGKVGESGERYFDTQSCATLSRPRESSRACRCRYPTRAVLRPVTRFTSCVGAKILPVLS